MNDIRFMVSDGMGVFMYIDRLKDDEDFIAIEIEEENDSNGYTSKIIALHKNEIIDVIDRLKELVEK